MKKKLHENPDAIQLDGDFQKQHHIPHTILDWGDADAYVFGYFGGILYGGLKTNHVELFYELDKKIKDDIISKYGWGKVPVNRNHYKYAGRLWIKAKTISFWEYPPKSMLPKIISDLKKNDIPVDENWFIEVVDRGGNYESPKTEFDFDSGWKVWSTATLGYVKLVKISEYIGSEKQTGKEIQHQLSPRLKKQMNVPDGVGSKKKPKGIKKGETIAQYHDRTRQEGIIKESSKNSNTKPEGLPRGKAPYMVTDGIDERPVTWEAKLKYWRTMIEKMIGYEVLE